jgi:hypothetical protein
MHEAKAGQRTRDVFAWREELPEPVKVVSDAQMPKVMGGDVLLFYRGDGVQAVKFDANTLRTVGPEVNVLSGLAPDTELITCGMYDVTSDGDLLYVPTTQTYEGAKLVWVAENGDQQELEQIESRMLALRLSYDATKIAYVAGGKSPTLFVHDLTRGTNWPVAEGFVVLPIWTRDGEFIIYEYAPDNGAPQELRSVHSSDSILKVVQAGVSHTRIGQVFAETFRAQRRHLGLAPSAACWALNWAKYGRRKLIGLA